MNTTLVRPTLAALCRIVLGSSIAIGLASGPPAFARWWWWWWRWPRRRWHGRWWSHGWRRIRLGPWRPHGWWILWPWRVRLRPLLPGFLRLRRTWPGVRPRLWLRLRLSGLWLRLRYGYGYPGYGYDSYPGYSYGSGYYYPDYTYGTGYVYPGSSYVVDSNGNSGYVAAPGSGYTYSSAYGTVPLQATTPAAPSSFPLPSLGIDEEKVSDATGSHIQVTRVHPGSPAERAGLKAGDTIVSANGYLTQDPGNLAWIINHHAPNGVVSLNIRKVANGQDATVNATLH